MIFVKYVTFISPCKFFFREKILGQDRFLNFVNDSLECANDDFRRDDFLKFAAILKYFINSWLNSCTLYSCYHLRQLMVKQSTMKLNYYIENEIKCPPEKITTLKIDMALISGTY